MLLALAISLVLAAPASATTVVSSFGEGPGQTAGPQGLAVDATAGRLYVADRGNHRVNVFETAADGFLTAYGWGVLNGASAPQQCTPIGCRQGIAGSGAGQFSSPAGVAVDPLTGDLYVSGDGRVQKLDAGGTFVLMIGKGVNQTTGGDLCTAASADICGDAEAGTGPGEFSTAGPALAVDATGTLYAGDEGRVQEFEPSGAFLKELPLTEGAGVVKALAVDSAGNVRVGTANGGAEIVSVDSAGSPLPPIPTPGEGTPFALATGPGDEIFAAQEGVAGLAGPQPASIARLDSAGAPLSVFGYELRVPASGGGLAVRPGGTGVYASEESGGGGAEAARVLDVSLPPPGPVVLPTLPPPFNGACAVRAAPIGNSKATLNACVNPEGVATTTHFEYIDQAGFEDGGFANPAVQSTPESAPIGADFAAHPVAAAIGCAEPQTPPQPSCLTPETTYRFRVVAEDGEGHRTIGPQASFETAPPLEIEATWSSEVGTASATLNAAVNPLGIPTTGHFEYVTDAQFDANGFDDAARVPAAEELDFGRGEEAVTGSVPVGVLDEGALYHYRVVVTDSLIAPAEIAGPPATFTTFRPGEDGLPDGRAYELASRTVGDSSAELGAILSPAAGLNDKAFALIQQASPSGGAVTYTSFTSFADPKDAPGASQYLSTRGAGGWATANIVPRIFVTNPLQPPTRGFSPDLGTAAMVMQPDEESFQNLYLQDDGSGALERLTPDPNPAKSAPRDKYCIGFAGASANAGRVIFLGNGALTANAPTASAAKFNLYEWSAAGGVRLASVLPGEAPAAATAEAGFGARGPGNCGLGATLVDHAISEDGSRIFWTFVSGTGQSRLLARLGGTETIQLDARQGGPGSSGGGNFWAAAADGSVVYFTDSNRLVPGASEGDANPQVGEGDLYRYDVDARTLTDITIDPTPGSDPPHVRGVLAASEDGSTVYFVAGGVLSGAPNGAGETAVPGENNLYVVRGEEAPRFIATLTGDDRPGWSRAPREQAATTTPDGRHLAFLSTASLTGFDNAIAAGSGCQLEAEELGGDPRCAQAYLFDAETGELTCASCNPSGERPLGPAAFRFWGSPFEQPRYLSDDGSRLFFDSLDALLPQDNNGRRDVYEFEREGVGGCTAASAGFDSDTGGCLFLISAGIGADSSFFLDASPDGRDVFISTRDALLPEDEDERYDVYDARGGGGFPPPAPPAPPCAGDGCRAPATPPPPEPQPGTGSFTGPSNVKPSKPRKHRHRKKHKSRGRHGGSKRTATAGGGGR